MKAETEDMMVSALQRISAELQSGYSAGKEFVADQAPEVARELITWGIVENSIWAVAFALGCGLFAYMTIRLWRWAVDDCSGAEPAAMFPGAVAIGCFAGFVFFAVDAAKVAIAPRVYLLEKGVSIAKGKF